MAEIEVVKILIPEPPPKDYRRELLIEKIANHICEDNEEVRKLIKLRMEEHTVTELETYMKNEGIPIL